MSAALALTVLCQLDQTSLEALRIVWARLPPETRPSFEEAFDDLCFGVAKSDFKRTDAVPVLQIGVRTVLQKPLHHREVPFHRSRRQGRAKMRINVVEVASSGQALQQ